MAVPAKILRWSSETGFVLATAAAAVGLGNLWRFPYITGENGGGAFILAYIISVVILGVPLMILEISAGRSERGSPVKTFRSIYPPAAVFGWFVVLLTLLIMSYYLVITGWTLGFAVEAARGNLISFDEFTATFSSLGYFIVVALITAVVVVRGIRAIELMAKIMMPLLIGMIAFLTIYSLSMPGRDEALAFLFNPDFSLWASPALWLLAFGQAFYSLAVGQGYLITYGSFLPDKVNLPRATGIVAGVETGVALIAGVMLFPFVFSFGLDPGQGTELAFSTLPLVFGEVPLGGILAVVFFSLFFLAAISSCIAGMEVVKTAIREEFNTTHTRAALLSFLPVIPLGVLSALSFTPLTVELLGRPFLEVVDLIAANQVVIVASVLGGGIISWNISREDLVNGLGTRWWKTSWWAVTFVRYLPIPVLLLVAVTLFL